MAPRRFLSAPGPLQCGTPDAGPPGRDGPSRGAAGPLDGPRAEIDAIDDQLLGLLSRRAGIAAGLAGLKAGPRDAGREAAVLRRLSLANPGPLPDAAVARIFGEIFRACLDVQAGPGAGAGSP
jgi:chorismate mutase